MEFNQIYNADVFDFLKKLDDDCIDLAIVDPPYNLKVADWDTFITNEKYTEFMNKWVDLLLPKLKTTSSLYIFNTAFNSASTLLYLHNKGLYYQNWIIWYKKDGFSAARRKFVNAQETILFFTKSTKHVFNYNDIRQPYLSTDRMKHAAKKGILKNGKRWFPNESGRLCSDVWEISSQRHKEKINGKVQKLLHPTQKPYEMIERMIKASSNEDDVVLDLFSGSGTTSQVAKNLRRRYIGCENNDDYIKYMEEEGLKIARL